MNILVTGATGFVGQHLGQRLMADGVHRLIAVVRNVDARPTAWKVVLQPDPWELADWRLVLQEVDVVIHLAGRAHVLRESPQEARKLFYRTNVATTLRLAEHCAAAGVRRFVFLSSIKVNGESTLAGVPFTADDVPLPLDHYGMSKWEAELGLREIAVRTGLEVTTIRPPLVYGPGVRANFAALLCAAKHGWPLPLALIDNKRSLVGLDNLVDLILVASAHSRAANQVFLVSDGEDLSTPQLIREMAQAMERRAYLFPVPVWALCTGARLVNRKDVMQRLCGSLQVDISKTKELLDWAPPIGIKEGLRRAVATF